MKKNEYLKSGIVLSTICIVLALLLGCVNLWTSPTIEENEKKATQEALFKVYPNYDETFDQLDIQLFENLPEIVTEAYSAKDGGYVIKVNTTGYKSNMILIFGISSSLEIVGAKCISANETLGYEKTYGENLIGKNSESVNGVDTVSNATSTTLAYKNAAKDVLAAAKLFAEQNAG